MTYGDEERRNRSKSCNDDTRIEKVDQVLPPIALLEKFPASEEAADLVHEPACTHTILFMEKMTVYL